MAMRAPVRLVYGPAPWAGYEGVVVEAELAAQTGRVARARTLGEFAEAIGQPWDEYLREWQEDQGYVSTEASDKDDTDEDDDLQEPPAPEDDFYLDEWFEQQHLFPEGRAWEVARKRVAQVAADGSEVGKLIEPGGSSPAGTDAISGPLAALEYLSTQIEPNRDGFYLERDDDLVAGAFPEELYD